jgi:hypothetical protein
VPSAPFAHCEPRCRSPNGIGRRVSYSLILRLIPSLRCQPDRNARWGYCGNLCLSFTEQWWSQTGSNRRPHACKARALPAELWPHSGCEHPPCLCHDEVVGLGRFELPTSRLSSARSNQLSYRPEARVFREKKEKRRRRHPALYLRPEATPSSNP